MREATVLLGVDDPGLQDEVHDYLDRCPAVRVVGAASEPEAAERLLRERRPDAVVATPAVAAAMAAPETRLLVVDRRETTESLRSAIRAGARGFYLWPDEREVLGADAEAARVGEATDGSGSVVAVCPARGGVGATFLATNLAAAFARLGASTLLADLDHAHGDTSWVLGGVEAPGAVQDLIPVADELGPEHLERIAGTHPSGFRFAAAAPDSAPIPQTLAPAILAATRRSFALTVVHLPRSLDDTVRAALLHADLVLVVATLDVPAVRAAQRTLELADDGTLRGRCRLVVNRATRGEIAPADAAKALGMPVAGVIPFDRSVERAQNRGELVMARRSGPAARRVLRLATSLMEAA